MNRHDRDRILQSVSPSHLMHLAWDTTPGKFWNSTANLSWLSCSLDLFKMFQESGGRRFIGVGTCAEYDWTHAHLNEFTTPYAPHTLYGTAKKALRETLEKAAALADVSFAWGHLFYLYGPREQRSRLVSEAIVSSLAGVDFNASSGTQLRDFMYVKDAAAALVALMDSDVAGSVNIASGEVIAVKDLLLRIEALTNRPGCMKLGVRPMNVDEPSKMVADITRLTEEVGFNSSYTLDSGLAESIAWWKKRLN